MMSSLYKSLLLPCFFLSSASFAQTFKVVPLGVKGGIDESNLSAYMVAPYASNSYICLDAGTLHAGIQKAIDRKVFKVPVEQVLKQYVKAYFISHSHLDHLGGLIINSPEDTSKTIYANADCIDVFKNNYFTWKAWANFANEGEKPQLSKYRYQVLMPGNEVNVAGTNLKVQAFVLSHSNLQSTAFLVNSNNNYLLYLGDTGPDEIEKSQNLQKLWQSVAPLIKAGQLKALMIEVSFPNQQPDKTLFGHFTPAWLMKEMNKLSQLTGVVALQKVNMVITHVKPPQSHILRIKEQLKTGNNMHLKLIFPEQGKMMKF
ncbi:MBL fold metallo-hydrolase [Mucilaginibacter terrae]|uniref:MBL fold metallo-hydrolase n=1 Tax=Mucilaginibacter terrae TaxID=1955052 RepID=UPI0036366F92